MRKFKLIEEYPGSPELGSIKTYTGNTWDENNQLHKSIVNSSTFSKHWEEVIEKAYEILQLSLLRSDKHQIVSTTTYGEDYILSLLACHGNKIHSVKRLSDGEVFTIGDKVNFNIKCLKELPIDNIKEFELKNNIIWARSKLHPYMNSLDNIAKVKTPLFTTDDGVKIYENDKFYFVNTHYIICEIIAKQDCVPSIHRTTSCSFQSRERAEEYILMNKPCLSIKDLEDIRKTKSCFGDALIRYATKLVKSKL